MELLAKLNRTLTAIKIRPTHNHHLNKTWMQVIIDAIICAFSLVMAHLLRFDSWPPAPHALRMWIFLPFVIVARIAANYSFGIYKRVWRYASLSDGILLAVSASVVTFVLLALRLSLAGILIILTIPLSVIFIDYLLVTFGMTGVRLLWRLQYENDRRSGIKAENEMGGLKKVLLAGAGDAGIMIVREIKGRPEMGLQICGFVDDDSAKHGTVIYDTKVIGKTADIPRLVKQLGIDQVIITMANVPRRTVRRILDLCETVQVEVKIIPGLYEILVDRVTVSRIHTVEIEDLLGRETINFNQWLDFTRSYYEGKRVLVTGGGGSIGRELCRQIAALSPEAIVILDKDEDAVFECEQEMRSVIGDRNIQLFSIIGNLKNQIRMEQIFGRLQPHAVLHAAAHKHVPLIERNVCEAVLNNILGARNLLKVCENAGVERCVMVSTDKAVYPTSIMGATKKVAELLFQKQAIRLEGKSHYSCVRFGNVLGSRGSVVPFFREQIKAGGPVTVTHPDMIRYFMTIPEAAQLIIQAGALGKKGEIFLLDMGEPVRLMDLAKDMIRLSGLTLGEDIEIKITGMRPGEKLKEELLTAEEGTEPTKYDKIFMAPPAQYDYQMLDHWVQALSDAAHEDDESRIYSIFADMGIGFTGSNK
jgi:FlaA1/EpsC-like NDP-sugar epimerase